MKTIITVILFTFISLFNIASAKQNPDQTPTGTYLFTIDDLYNELDLLEMDQDSLSLNEIKNQISKRSEFTNADYTVTIVQLQTNGKFKKIFSTKIALNDFDEQDYFVKIKID